MLKILGYPDKYSVAPGEENTFYVSAEHDQSYEASLVRVICGDCNPDGPGLLHEPVASNIDGTYAGKKQRIDAGSYMTARVRGFDLSSGFSFFAMVWPTLIKKDDQTIFSCWDASAEQGVRVFMTAGGALALEIADREDRQSIDLAQTPMYERQWYSIHCSLDPLEGRLVLSQRPLKQFAFVNDRGSVTADCAIRPALDDGTVIVAGRPQAGGGVGKHFDGKVDQPALLKGSHPHDLHETLLLRSPGNPFRGSLVALWDFPQDMSSTRAVDVSGNENHGRFVNGPARAMKGWNWTGEFHRWTERPDHYGAAHFHHDDLYDADWEPAFSLAVPPGLKSGAYAIRLKSGGNTREETNDYYVPFFVRPARRPPGVAGSRSKIAFLAPTASYIAYANHAEHITAREAERVIGRLLQFGHADMYMYENPEIGLSLYDVHLDGSGVCYSSRRRPVLNFTSQYHSWLGGHGSALWQYNADTHLLAWLDHKGFEHDVITDEDLHFEGLHLLEDYRVLITGTHPEYYSTKMHDALKSWLDTGGRLMYLGANGFYWHVDFSEDMPGLMEVRRAEDGIRTWAAEPGEYYHSFTGEMGGLYRRRGHAPNEIGAVGFIAQGFDMSSYYRRAPDADNPRARFIFEGIDDEIIGDFGLIGGGAAGLELDCITTGLGSPPNTLRLATSENHTQMVMLVNEEFGVVPPNLGGDQNEKVRADIAFAEHPSGGAVFATGSIAWCGALPVSNFDNNVSRMTENVLRRFAKPEPFSTDGR